jgi:hypothetical protein
MFISLSKRSLEQHFFSTLVIGVFVYHECTMRRHAEMEGNFAIFYMLAKYVPGDIKYIFTKFYRHISTNNEANRKFVILISNFSTSL